MTLTKSDLARKIGDECGFMKAEGSEILEKLLDIIKSRLISGEDVLSLRLRQMVREIQACSPWAESSDR